MMFKARFEQGIVDGAITTTFRFWKRAQARAGSYQKLGRHGYIQVVDVKTVKAPSIRERDAKQAGFDSVRELAEYIEAYRNDDRELYRVDFKFVGDRPDLEPDRSAACSDSEIAMIDKALDLRDRNSGFRWTRQTLALVGEHPGMSSKELALKLGRDRAELKTDMRKLKKLGLTESLEVGYKLSPKGASWLNAQHR